jgi:hypothetical protein
VPNGKLPSGTQYEDILQRMCEELWLMDNPPCSTADADVLDMSMESTDDSDEAKSADADDVKAAPVTNVKKKPMSMPDHWVPEAMVLFCWHGPLGGSCCQEFSLQSSEGPASAAGSPLRKKVKAESDSESGNSSISDSGASSLSRSAVLSEVRSRSELRAAQKQKKESSAAARLESMLQGNSDQLSNKLDALTSVMQQHNSSAQLRAAEKLEIQRADAENNFLQQRKMYLKELMEFTMDSEERAAARQEYLQMLRAGPVRASVGAPVRPLQVTV